MSQVNKRKKLFIEASAITELHMSGIGHSIVETITALSELDEFTKDYEIILLVSKDTKKNLKRWNFNPAVIKVKTIWLEKHILQILLKYGLLPPMDLFIGKGIYLFPNYKNWPLLYSRSITYIYDVAFAIFPETVQPKNLKMLQKNIPKWIKRTDFLVTISETSKKEIVKYLNVSPNKIGVVYCGVNSKEYYKRSQPDINKIKLKYKIDKDYILVVGNIEPRKNLNNLLDAYSKLPKLITNEYNLVLIGSGGWLNEDILSKIKLLQESGYSIIRPQTFVPDEDLPALYSGASLLAHAAIHEGFGIPPLQAMATETPIAVSDIGAIREVAGTSATYFNPNNQDSIRESLQRVLENSPKNIQQINKGLELSHKFNWSSSARELEGYIDKVS
jgi:glycosyltransferase involved in cell wall biosynthesis